LNWRRIMEIFEVCQEQGLTTSSSSSHTVSSRWVPFQERAFSLGDVIGSMSIVSIVTHSSNV
jgi:hypothetical protein